MDNILVNSECSFPRLCENPVPAMWTHTYVNMHSETSALSPISSRTSVWGLGTKLLLFFFFPSSSFLLCSHCFIVSANYFFFPTICLLFSFSLQASNLDLEDSLGCQATSFSLFKFSGKNVAHPFILSPWQVWAHSQDGSYQALSS